MTSTARITPIEAPLTLGTVNVDYAALGRRYPAFGEFGRSLGKTPLIEVPGPEGGAALLAKCEWHNPEGSIKDRVAYALIGAALEAHGDRPLEELRILEYSGGNLTRALSRLCSELGMPARFVLSSATPRSLLETLEQRGSAVDLVDKELGFVEVIRHALRIAADEPEWHLLYQHRNPANLAFHEKTTGAELLADLGSRIPDAWVASIGTGGTLIGVLRSLRVVHPSVRAIATCPSEMPYASVEPPNGHPKFAGSGGFGNGLRQPFVTLFDDEIEHHTVSYPRCLEAMAEFRDRSGIRIGSSAAANWLVAYDIAAKLPASANVVTVFPDAGSPEEWERIG